MLRLKKPLAYYHDKYGSALHGFQKLFLLMEKQHNRGQDGIGVGQADRFDIGGRVRFFLVGARFVFIKGLGGKSGSDQIGGLVTNQ